MIDMSGMSDEDAEMGREKEVDAGLGREMEEEEDARLGATIEAPRVGSLRPL